MDWSHFLTAVATAIVALLGAWTTRRHKLAKIARAELSNESAAWEFMRGEWERLLAEERDARKKLLERSEQVEKNREELRDKLTTALIENLELKTRLQCATDLNQGLTGC